MRPNGSGLTLMPGELESCGHAIVSRSVLIVDDQAGFRRMAGALLEAEGFDVLGEAADGETALIEAVRLRPGLVLLDIQLPDLGGFEVAARLASLADPPGGSSRCHRGHMTNVIAMCVRHSLLRAQLPD